MAEKTASVREMMAELDEIAKRNGIKWGAAERFNGYEPARPAGNPNGSASRIVERATEAQVRYMRSLAAERDLGKLPGPLPELADIEPGKLEQLSKRAASAVIEKLVALPRLPREPREAPAPRRESAPRPAPATVEPGMYRAPDGAIYKVQLAVHGSGQPYAKRLDVEAREFVYEPGAIRRIEAEWRMTAEEAADFGQLYGFCCVCARTLTDERSIAAGIGPVCAKKV